MSLKQSVRKANTRSEKKRLQESLEKLEEKRWEDVRESEKEMLIAIQTKHFMDERREIKKAEIHRPDSRKEMAKKDSPLTPHNPFLDEDGVIRVGSRLMYAEMEAEAKFPAILPKEDRNVQDLIRWQHEKDQHAGNKHVLCNLRQRFWILQGMQAVKKVINKCLRCQKMKKSA